MAERFLILDDTLGRYKAKNITVLSASVHTVDPVSTDDANSGYLVGDRWINSSSNEEFVCINNTVSSAIWVSTTTGGGGGSANRKVDVFDATLNQHIFTLSFSPLTDSETVSLEGIVLSKGVSRDYTISGTTLTLNASHVVSLNQVLRIKYEY